MKISIQEGQREDPDQHQPSQLFLLRVWIPGEQERRHSEDLAGRLQDAISGQVQYFRGGVELVRILDRAIF